MLYVLYGSDTRKGREKLHTLVDTLQAKRPDAALLRFDEETYELGILDELMYGQGLFSPKSIVVLDNVFKNADAKDDILKNLKPIGVSENVFVLLEGALDKKTVTKLERHAKQVQPFEGREKKEERFNVFSLTDALGRRDRKKLWVLYQQAKRRGISDEEIHGVLFWQLKSLLLAECSSSAKAAGLNPFVYKKSLGFLRGFSKGELLSKEKSLVHIYHEARRGRYELGSALEQFILAI